MANLIAKADGNLTGSTTFATADTGSGATTLIRNTTTNLAAAGTYTSSTFTVTNAAVIDAVVLFVFLAAVSPTGTFKVDLQKSGVSQASVTVNKTDLPQFYSVAGTAITPKPMLFKLGSTATGDGAATWTIVITTTGTVAVTLATATATTTNCTRALRTTTTATPAAGDDLYMFGELTGAGTKNVRAITMNSTANTAYGSAAINSTTVAGGCIWVGSWCTLAYGTASSTNYILRVSGDLFVTDYGILQGGGIPRGSTGVLEFNVVTASGNFGLQTYGGTIDIQALSRTSGKNVSWCRLNADTTSLNVIATNTFTATNATLTANAGQDATGISPLYSTFVDTVTNANHTATLTGSSVAGNTTQSATVHLTRGSGTNNRFVRLYIGNATTIASVTNGLFVDIDLQAVTVGTVTAVGNGTATSASITAVGTGYLIRMTGAVSSVTATPSVILAVCSAAGTVSFAGANNQALIFGQMGLVTGTISDTTYNVDADTGWLSGDVAFVTSSTQDGNQAELFALSANAGSSSMTTKLYPICYPWGANIAVGTKKKHHGTDPLFCEVGLITRNFKIRNTSANPDLLTTYVYADPAASLTLAWVEIYGVGSSTSFQHGLSIMSYASGQAVAKSITFCSLHDCFYAFYNENSSALRSINLVFNDNVVWRTTNGGVLINSSTGDYIVKRNLVVRYGGSGFGFGAAGGDCQDNVASSCIVSSGGSYEWALGVGAVSIIGTFKGNEAHTASMPLLYFQNGSVLGLIENFKGWRCTASFSSANVGTNYALTYKNITFFGCTSASGTVNSSAFKCSGTCIICSDVDYPGTVGFVYSGASTPAYVDLDVQSLDMTGVSLPGGVGAAFSSNEFSFANNVGWIWVRANLTNGSFGSPALISGKSVWSADSYMYFEKYNRTAGDHRTEMTYGQLKTDSTFYNTAAPSMRMTPNDLVNRLESAPKGRGIQAAVANGATVTASVWVRKDTAYAGNQPRLIARTNYAIGITSDIVLATDTDPPVLTSVAPTWDASTALSTTLSNGNLTATSTTSADHGVHVASSYGQTTGKYYFELTITTLTGGADTGFGVGTTASTYGNMGGSATTGVIMYPSTGNIWANGGNTGVTLGARSAGQTICGSVDLTNRKMWFRVGSAGNWNNSGTDNPATNTGGITIPAGTMVPWNTFNASGNVFTVNFGVTSYVGTAPSGFSNWPSVTVSGGSGTWVQLSGTTGAATDNGAVELVVDCDGTVGFINVDDWAANGAPICDMTKWFNGLPISGGGGGGGETFYGSFT